MANVRIDWRGQRVGGDVKAGLSAGLTEFGLRCETAAKRRLQPSQQDAAGDWVEGGGHGVRTGTLRRSIHTGTPGYSWGSDDVPPSRDSPERGGQDAKPADKAGKLTLELGSGLEYAIYVHQAHTDPEVYHFITAAVDGEAPKLPGILKRHVEGKAG